MATRKQQTSELIMRVLLSFSTAGSSRSNILFSHLCSAFCRKRFKILIKNTLITGQAVVYVTEEVFNHEKRITADFISFGPLWVNIKIHTLQNMFVTARKNLTLEKGNITCKRWVWRLRFHLRFQKRILVQNVSRSGHWSWVTDDSGKAFSELQKNKRSQMRMD